MKTFDNLTRHICEHCNREYKRIHFAIAHEPKCRKNPDNFQKCLDGCSYLIKKEVEIRFDFFNGNFSDRYEKKELLFCEAKEEFVHPYWVDGFYSEDIKGEIPNEVMPKECNLYKH